jgi:arginine decarboxylase
MQISIVSGTGTGPTSLAAFDAALVAAGAANYNLLVLSSVIPAKTEIVRCPPSPLELPGSWGDRLWVVMAAERVEHHNSEAWAGVGWVQDATSGRGLFVEHEGQSRQSVERDINDSLQALVASRPEVQFGAVDMQLEGIRCQDDPVCAVVLAVYDSSPWPQQRVERY